MERCYGNGQGRGGGGGLQKRGAVPGPGCVGIARQAEALSGWPFPRRTCACPSPSELWGAVERPTSAVHTHVRAAQPASVPTCHSPSPPPGSRTFTSAHIPLSDTPKRMLILKSGSEACWRRSRSLRVRLVQHKGRYQVNHCKRSGPLVASEELLAARELRETKAARRLSRRGHLGPGSWRAAALGEPCHPAREACSQRGRRAPEGGMRKSRQTPLFCLPTARPGWACRTPHCLRLS